MRSRALILFGCVLFAIPLIAHAYAGTASRYVGDDYCGGYIFRDEGLFGGQRWFYMHWGAVPSTVFLIGLTTPLGAAVTPWLTSIALVLWVAALTFAVARIFKAIGLNSTVPVALLLAELIVVATLGDTPNVIQSLYLRVPMFEYILPLVLLSAAAGALACPRYRDQASMLSIGGWIVLAFVAGNFGPTYAAMQTTACVLAIVLNRFVFGRSRRLEWVLAAAVVGSVAALACIALAPGNAARQTYFPPPPGIAGIAKWTVLSTVFMFARPALPLLRGTIEALVPRLIGPSPSWLNVALAMTASPLTLVALAGVPLWIATDDRRPASTRRARQALVWLPCVAVVLVMACMAPSAYGTSSPPPPRTLVIPQFAMAMLVAAWGYALGVLVRSRATGGSALRTSGLAAIAIVAVLVPLTAALGTFRLGRELHAWAARWDETDRQLRQAAAERRAVADVPAVGSIGAVGSIAIDPKDWVNACAAKYYGVPQIVGHPPS